MDMPTVSIFNDRIAPGGSRDPLIAALAASKAPETRRAYRTAWTFWNDWQGITATRSRRRIPNMPLRS